MSDDLLAALLEQLRGGDAEAVEEVFRRYEPYLRMVVRRKITPTLRAKFDSMDVVQSIWADLFSGFQNGRWKFSDSKQLQAFLVRAASNRLVDAVRRTQREVVRAGDGALLDAIPQDADTPSEDAVASDTWNELISLCEPEHRLIVELKQQGASLDEIAGRTGFHKSSVRRILYDLARRLDERRRTARG